VLLYLRGRFPSGFSYGFRPKRPSTIRWTPGFGITARRLNFILDAGLRSFFVKSASMADPFCRASGGDPRIIRLIQKWLKVGWAGGRGRRGQVIGTVQGSVISPLLAKRPTCTTCLSFGPSAGYGASHGRNEIVRYADDIVVGFAHEVE